MQKACVRAVRDGDFEFVLEHARQADRDECDAMLGPDKFEAALRASVNASVLLWTFEVHGKPAAIFGVCPISMLSGIGAPWLIGTYLVDKAPGALVRLSRLYIPKMQVAFPLLCNVVDARNVKSVAYLRRLGFEFGGAITMGPEHMLFYPFSKE